MSRRDGPAVAPEPVVARGPRGARAAWLVGALLFLVSAGLPWSSCRNYSPVAAGIDLTLATKVRDQLWGLAVLLPLCLLAGVAAFETRGQAPRRPLRALLGAGLAALTSLGIHAVSNVNLAYNWSPRSRLALRVLIPAPAVLALAWAAVRRARNSVPLALRLVAASAALGLPLAWAPVLDRAGATLGYLAAAGLLVFAPAVPDAPSPLGSRARLGVSAALGLYVVAVTWLLFLGQHRPRFLSWPLHF